VKDLKEIWFEFDFKRCFQKGLKKKKKKEKKNQPPYLFSPAARRPTTPNHDQSPVLTLM
jgi:hypothetical protein